MKLVDAHTHVQFHAFEADSREVIERAFNAGVWLINVGTQIDTSRKAIALAESYSEGVYAAIGLHPIHTSKSFHDAQELGEETGANGFTSRGEEFDSNVYLELAANSKVVAIGECGLDYYRLEKTVNAQEQIEKQKIAFIKQIELAWEVKKPLMIHCRDAFSDLIEILKGNKSNLKSDYPGVIHFFTGTPEDAKILFEMGFAFTFGGVITFARNYDEIIKMLPADVILSETDAPYLAPVPYRGKRNEPAYVVETVRALAKIKNISFEQMAEITRNNAKRIFKI